MILTPASMALIILWCGVAFLAVALLIGIATAIQTLAALRAQAKAERQALLVRAQALGADPDLLPAIAPPTPLPSLLDALGKLIETLAKAPAWFAMYLGGLALLWLGADLIKPEPAPRAPAPETRPQPGGAAQSVRPNPVTTQTRTTATETRSASTAPVVPGPTPSPGPS